MEKFKILLLFCIIIFASDAATGEEPDVMPAPSVSLITCSPGEKIYELCGHTALRVRAGGDIDMAVNYGTFDFSAPNFVYRFVNGETDYMVSAYPFRYFLEEYRRQGRSVTEQPLNLTDEEATRLVEMLDENLQPANRTYRYNYVKDNCSTRPLMMVERAMGRTVSFPSDPADSLTTFREIMRHHHVNYPWYQFGIDLALGSGIDYRVSVREKTFAPLLLKEMMDSATIGGCKAVNGSVTLLEAVPGHGPLSPTPVLLSPMAVALAILLLTVVVAVCDIRRRRITRWVDAALFGAYGLAGCLIAFLVFVSIHEATSPNWLLLWLNPLCLLVPALIYIKKCRRLVKLYGFINFAALILLIVMWPWLGQSGNPAFLHLVTADVILTLRYLYITLCVEKATPD